MYESESPQTVECPFGRTALQVPFSTFARNMPAGVTAQLPQDVQILSVGFYADKM